MRLTARGFGDIAPGRKKGGLNFLYRLPSQYFDCVFISIFLEHLDSSTQVMDLLKRVKDLLRPGGKLIILQPNFRLLGAAYFDFIDHKTILTDKS